MMLQTKFRSVLHRFPRVQTGNVVALSPANDLPALRFTLSWPDFAKNRRRQCVATNADLQCTVFADKYAEFDLKRGTGELPAQVLCQAWSPSNRLLARLLLIENKQEEEQVPQIEVQVLDRDSEERIISVRVDSVHGSVLASEGIHWHASEDLFAYVADAQPSAAKSAEHKFEYREDWGEGYEGIVQPKIFLFDIKRRKANVAIPPALMDVDTSQFQPRFHPSADAIVLAYRSITMQTAGLKLGLLYCAQRPSEIHLAWLNKRTLQVERNLLASPHASTADCPTFYAQKQGPSAAALVYLSSPPFETHGGPMQISKCEFDIASQRIKSARAITPLSLFPSQPLCAQSIYGNELVLSAHVQARERLLSVNLVTGEITNVDDDAPHSNHLLAVSPIDGRLLYLQSSPGNAGTILFGKEIVFQAPKPEFKITHHVLHHEETGCNSILILPASIPDSQRIPLIVCPHGGPHSAFTTQYMAEYAYLVEELSCALLLVNYRGSLGLLADDAKASVESLLGRVGELDVNDVMHSMEDCLKRFPQMLDASRVAVSGGSHGGFLAAHLSGQFPDRFRCAAMRNPVIDISTMFSTTDIPDWCKVEALAGGFTPCKDLLSPTTEQLARMRECSPIHHITRVKLPSLLCCGVKDRRVPYQSQGLFYYRALRMRGLDAKLLVFPQDGHPIDRVTSAEAMWAETCSFMKKHLAPTTTSEELKFQGLHLVLKA